MPTRAAQFRHLLVAAGLAWTLVGLTGCAIGDRARWQPPIVAMPLEPSGIQSLAQRATAEGAAEQSYALAAQLETAGKAACVEHYFQATAWAWTALEPSLTTATPVPPRRWSLYHSALTQLLVTAQRFGRWNPRQGLMLRSNRLGCLASQLSWFPLVARRLPRPASGWCVRFALPQQEVSRAGTGGAAGGRASGHSRPALHPDRASLSGHRRTAAMPQPGSWPDEPGWMPRNFHTPTSSLRFPAGVLRTLASARLIAGRLPNRRRV